MARSVSRSYFRLTDSKQVPGRWYPRAPMHGSEEIDPRLFIWTHGPLQLPPGLVLSLRRPGRPMDWTEGDNGMPVVSEKAGRILQEIAADEVQLFPVRVTRRREPFHLMKTLHAVECVDESRSTGVERWTKDSFRPDLAGSYQSIFKLIIYPEKAQGLHLFRVKDWEVGLIASQEIKDAFEREQIVGALFHPVT